MVLRRIRAHMRDLSGALLRSVLTNSNKKHNNTMKHLFVRELRIPTYVLACNGLASFCGGPTVVLCAWGCWCEFCDQSTVGGWICG